MSNTEKIKEVLLSCECHGYHYVEIYNDPDPMFDDNDILYVAHIERPKGWRQKLKAVWGALKNEDIYDGELILKNSDYRRLAEFFTARAALSPQSDTRTEKGSAAQQE